ncbi:MAG: T9SS type A sorting domain-containing protein [bacterium]
MNRIRFILTVILFSAIKIFAQADTLISYNCRTKEISIIIPSGNFSTGTGDNTNWHYPNELQYLNTNPPTDTYPNSGFTYFSKAQPQLDKNKFPLSAIVNLKRFVNGSLLNWCTGTMISPKLVLTCAHGIWINNSEFVDSLLAAPGYDNNEDNSLYGTAVSTKFYIPISWYFNTGWEDIAIIELEKPIGNSCGWMGIAFNNDHNYFDDRVLHKFSYPGNDYDQYPEHCGDTLYYNYGLIDVDSFGDVLGLGYKFPSFLGQSGSSIFYTNNNEYLIYGTLSMSSDSPPLGPISLHYCIKSNVFNALRYIIESTDTFVQTPDENIPESFSLEQNYPNPFNPVTTICYRLPQAGLITLEIFNVLGQKLETLVNEFQTAGKYQLQWKPQDLPSGIYFYRIKSGQFINTKKMEYLK